MHRLGLYTLCIFYNLLCYAAALSITVPSTTHAVLAPSTKTSTSLHLDTSTLQATSRGTHGPHVPSHASFSISHHPWTPSPASVTSSSRPQRSHHPIQTRTILGIIFGGLAGLMLVGSVGRCWWSWRKTPSRDRIETLLHRYNLEREMEQATLEPLRARVRRPPPPPYRPPPPGYESVMPSSPPAAHLEMPASGEDA